MCGWRRSRGDFSKKKKKKLKKKKNPESRTRVLYVGSIKVIGTIVRIHYDNIVKLHTLYRYTRVVIVLDVAQGATGFLFRTIRLRSIRILNLSYVHTRWLFYRVSADSLCTYWQWFTKILITICIIVRTSVAQPREGESPGPDPTPPRPWAISIMDYV